MNKSVMAREKAPNLFLVGAQKSATTSLSTTLATHPEIYLPGVEEPHFFCRKEEVKKGINYYIERYYSNASSEKYKMDASTSYMIAPDAPKFIDRLIDKKKKFLFILRHPVDRIMSAYTFHRNFHGIIEERSLEDIFPNRDQIKKLELKDVLIWEKKKVSGLRRSGHKKRRSWEEFGFPLRYFHVSKYSSHIERFLDIYDEENICFLKFDDFVKEKNTNGKVSDFLQIDEGKLFEEGEVRKNKTVGYSDRISRIMRTAKEVLKPIVPISVQKMMIDVESKLLEKRPVSYKFDPKTYFHLNQIFDEEIGKTAELTGLDLADWLSKNRCVHL